MKRELKKEEVGNLQEFDIFGIAQENDKANDKAIDVVNYDGLGVEKSKMESIISLENNEGVAIPKYGRNSTRNIFRDDFD